MSNEILKIIEKSKKQILTAIVTAIVSAIVTYLLTKKESKP